MYHVFCIHESVSGHCGGFHFLTAVKHAAVNAGVRVSFLPIYTQGGTAGSDDSSAFSFLRKNHQSVMANISIKLYLKPGYAQPHRTVH